MLRCSLAVLGFIGAMLVLRPFVAESTELLLNGGFESGVGDWGHTDGILDTVASPVHEGAAAGRLTGASLHIHEVYQFFDVQAGAAYTFSGRVYLDDPGASRAFLKIRWLSSSGDEISNEQSSSLTIHKREYQAIATGNLTAPVGAVRARFGLLVEPVTAFTVYLDGFSIDGPAHTPAPTPAATPLATPSPTAVASATPSPAASPSATSTPPPPPTATPIEVAQHFAVLTNAGFEYLDDDGVPYGWRKVGGQMSTVGDPHAEGSRALLFASTTTSTKWVYQTVSVEPGAYYDASVFGLKNDPGADAMFLRLSWYAAESGEGSAISSVDSTGLLTDDGPAFRLLATGDVQAPSGARSVRVKLMLRPASAAMATGYFDDVRLTRVPPPAVPPATSVASGAPRSARTSFHATPNPPVTAVALGAASTPVVPANVRSRASPAPAPGSAERSESGLVSYAAVMVAAASLGVAGFSVWRRRGDRNGA